MKNDSVTTAFEIILEEIESVVTGVNSQGAAFLKNNEYSKAIAAIETGKKLDAFHKKLESLKGEWVSGLDEPTRRQVNVETSIDTRTITSGSKAAKTGLAVKFKDGTLISGTKAAETFAKAIKKLGLQRVIALRIKVNYFPLVSKERSEKYSQTEIDGYLVMTHSSTEDKRDQLLKIAAALNEQLTIEVIPSA